MEVGYYVRVVETGEIGVIVELVVGNWAKKGDYYRVFINGKLDVYFHSEIEQVSPEEAKRINRKHIEFNFKL